MGYESKIISDPLTLLGDKERGSCTRFSGLKCNGLLERVCLSKLRHVKEVPMRIRSNKTELKKSIQIDFNKNEKQKTVVEYLQEEEESV